MTGAETNETIGASDTCIMVDHLFRSRAGQMVAYLTRVLGPEHLDLAEEVTQEALLKALQHWPYTGIPQNPAGWLFRVARNSALDAVRHRTLAGGKSAALGRRTAHDTLETTAAHDAGLEEQLRDDELRMVLMCCHPSLPQDARVALSLKTVGGFSVTRDRARVPGGRGHDRAAAGAGQAADPGDRASGSNSRPEP